MKIRIKKVIKIAIIILGIFLISGLTAVIVDRFFMPWASNCDAFKKVGFFRRANEKVTIINKTEQITVKEDFSLTKVAEDVSSAVVSIVTFRDGNKDSSDGLLKIKSSNEIENSIRTGVILTSDGIVMSVLDERTQELIENGEVDPDYYYKVFGPNGQEYDAELLVIDSYSNLVFYKIEGENFPVPEFGNSDEIESGEKIIICGNASGEYQNIYSQGIVQENDRGFSLLNSELSSSEKMEGAIMTSTEIDSRNIGGPVVDFNGTMIGLANRIKKDGEYIGFIMPINNIHASIDEIIKNKKIERPYFGIYYLPIDREISILNHLSIKSGALVYSFSGQQGLAVIKGSPADKAGIKIGDIIIEVNGEKIELNHSLSSMITDCKKGDKLEIKIIRDGEEKMIEIVLGSV